MNSRNKNLCLKEAYIRLRRKKSHSDIQHYPNLSFDMDFQLQWKLLKPRGSLCDRE
jgi:hypothetical protein